jgi:hypothetical protein
MTVLQLLPEGSPIEDFTIYCLSDGPADGKTQVRCILHKSIDDIRHPAMEPAESFHCGLLTLDATARRYELTVFDSPLEQWKQRDRKDVATIGGIRFERDRTYRTVERSGKPDESAFDPSTNKDRVIYCRKLR